MAYQHPEKTHEDIRKDVCFCQGVADISVDWFTELANYGNDNRQAFRQCMLQKGYTAVKVSTLPDGEPYFLLSGREWPADKVSGWVK